MDEYGECLQGSAAVVAPIAQAQAVVRTDLHYGSRGLADCPRGSSSRRNRTDVAMLSGPK